MAAPSVTYTFSNSTTADATQVNTNFTDLVNSLSDGLKDLTISSLNTATLTVSGAATFNGTVALGNATSDDITVTGYIASAVSPKTANTYALGSSSQTWSSLYLGTSLVNPLLVGGSGTTQTLTYKTTSGVGTTGADHIFVSGNNGATEIVRFINAGLILVGTGSTQINPSGFSGTGYQQAGSDSSGKNNMILAGFGNGGPTFTMGRSKHATIGTYSTAVVNADALGTIDFMGSDGTTSGFVRGAQIVASATGTWSNTSRPSSIDLKTVPSGSTTSTTALTIDSAQSVIPQKLLDLSTSTAGQIKFPASQNASADANTLDDYEEGTFTPSLKLGSTAATASTALGFYVKSGQNVFITGTITVTNLNGGTGTMTIASFPFTSNTTSGANGYLGITYAANMSTFTGARGLIEANNTVATIYLDNAATYTAATHANASATTQLYFAGTYRASA